MKSFDFMGALFLGTYILKDVRIVHIVVVEDVLVLVRERDRLVHLVHLASLVQTGPPPARISRSRSKALRFLSASSVNL